ncbi:hypothetical protein JOC69_002392 [Heliobacterium gestii]|nr:hypothetical protein [Heliomicrobium gestii]
MKIEPIVQAGIEIQQPMEYTAKTVHLHGFF